MKKILLGLGAASLLTLCSGVSFADDKPVSEKAGDSLEKAGSKMKHKARSAKHKAKAKDEDAKAKAEDEKSK